MDKRQFIHSQLLVGSKADFEMVIRNMSPIKGVPGINQGYLEWWICPETACVIHLVKVEDRSPLEPRYYFYLVLYNPNGRGFTKSGHKVIRIGEKTYSLPHLMALTFISNDEPSNVVVFKNGNKRDIRAENLKWVPRKEARKYKIRIKLNLKRKPQETM